MRLLLVEDDARIARFVAKGLREQTYAVDVSATGEDALYQAAVNTYDLVILDVMIPAPDGFAVCRELRKSGQRMPILMLTARDAVEDRIAGLDHGADDYLTKPFEFRELLARLRALLRRSVELRPPQITVADLVLDTGAQTIARGGRNIPVTTKEYALIEFLARNVGRVVGRAEIAEHVSGNGRGSGRALRSVSEYGTSRNVGRLRRRCRAPGNVGGDRRTSLPRSHFRGAGRKRGNVELIAGLAERAACAGCAFWSGI